MTVNFPTIFYLSIEPTGLKENDEYAQIELFFDFYNANKYQTVKLEPPK